MLIQFSLVLTIRIVHVGQEHGTMWTIDTTGTRLGRPISETTLRAIAQLRTSDGQLITDHVLWSVPTPQELPDEVTMHDQLRQMHAGLDALNRKLKTLENFQRKMKKPMIDSADMVHNYSMGLDM